MVDNNNTAKYLNDNIGGVLSKALAEMAIAQPTDGVNFLSRWLSTYAELEEAKKWRDQEAASVEEDRSRAQTMLAEKADSATRKAAQMKRKISEFQGLLDLLGSADTVFTDKLWMQLLSTVQTFTGAQAVYLGLLDEEGIEGVEGKCIVYTHTTAGSEWMLEKILNEGVGVTWGALTETPGEEVLHLWRPPKKEPVVPTDADDADAEPPPEEPAEPFLPVSIDYVTDVAEVHYFDMTRLGAYLAVPLVYTSYYTADAIADATKYEEDKKAAKAAAEQAAAEKAAQGGDAADDAAAAAGDEPQADTPAEAPMVLRGNKIKMVLCLDSLGKNTVFEATKIPQLLELCKAFGGCKERTETQQVATQAISVMDEREQQQNPTDEVSKASRIAKLRTELDEPMKQQMDEEKEAAKAKAEADGVEFTFDKELAQEKYKYIKARTVFSQCKDLFLELTTWVVAPQEMLNIMAGTFYMYGLAKEEIYPKRKSMLKWETLKGIIVDPKFLAVVEKKDVCEQRKDIKAEHKLASIRELASPADFTEEKAREISPALEVLYSLIQAAISYRSKDLTTRKEAWNKRKEKTEEAGEEFKETPLEDIDDDFAELA